MKVQINCEHANNSRPLNELAILYKRFSLNASTIVRSIPLTLQTAYTPKVKFLQTQIQDADLVYRGLIRELNAESQRQYLNMGYSGPSTAAGG